MAVGRGSFDYNFLPVPLQACKAFVDRFYEHEPFNEKAYYYDSKGIGNDDYSHDHGLLE